VGEAVRAAVLERAAARHLGLLDLLGLRERGELTAEAIAFYEGVFVFGDDEAAKETHRAALLRQPVTQALIQGLHGRGPVSFEGALHFLARHRLAALEDATAVRALFVVLNAAGVIAWSKQRQTVRILVELPETTGEFDPIVRVIERERPFSNAMHLRRIIRSCERYLHWVEPHLPRKALESLISEADGSRLKEIKLVSRPPKDEELALFKTDWQRFKKEMKALGIEAEWRLVPPKSLDLHDRYIVGRNTVWNVPPVNSIHKGDYAEAFKTPNRPPFDRWWQEGTAL
jgi:hypothetical protein